MTENKVLTFFNSLSEDVKSKLKELTVEMAETPETPETPAATEIPLADGTIAKVIGEVGVGAEVIVVTPEGEVPAPEGDLILADNSILVIKKEGEKSVIGEVKPAEAMTEEKKEDVAMEAVKSLEAKFSSLENENKELKKEIEALKITVSKTKTQLSKAVSVVAEMAAIPTEEPAKTPEKASKKSDKMLQSLFGK